MRPTSENSLINCLFFVFFNFRQTESGVYSHIVRFRRNLRRLPRSPDVPFLPVAAVARDCRSPTLWLLPPSHVCVCSRWLIQTEEEEEEEEEEEGREREKEVGARASSSSSSSSFSSSSPAFNPSCAFRACVGVTTTERKKRRGEGKVQMPNDLLNGVLGLINLFFFLLII